MKIVIVTIGLFIVLVGFGAFAYRYTNNTANHLAAKITAIEDNTSSSKWQQAEADFNHLQKDWARTSAKWTMLLDHQELDNINITMSRITQFIKTRDISGARSELAELKMLLQHIPEKEALNLKNIL